MNLMPALLTTVLKAVPVATSQTLEPPAPPAPAVPTTTEVMVVLTVRQGVTREQIMAVMPDEVRATVKLYLAGKIRQWYSRGDGKGTIFLVDAKTEDEARAVMEALPLARERLMDHDYVAVGPLLPLMSLLAPGASADPPPTGGHAHTSSAQDRNEDRKREPDPSDPAPGTENRS